MIRKVDGFGRRAKLFSLLAALALASGATLAACGSEDDDDGGSTATAEGGEITISQTSQPDYLDPALVLHRQRDRAAVARLHAAAHLSPRRG